MPPTVMRIARAVTAPAAPTREAMRVTSWLPMKVWGVKESRNVLWRVRFQSSSKKLESVREDQIAFHSSYWVSVSMVESATILA